MPIHSVGTPTTSADGQFAFVSVNSTGSVSANLTLTATDTTTGQTYTFNENFFGGSTRPSISRRFPRAATPFN